MKKSLQIRIVSNAAQYILCEWLDFFQLFYLFNPHELLLTSSRAGSNSIIWLYLVEARYVVVNILEKKN